MAKPATMAPITWSNVQVTLGELQPWADNPRLSSKRQAQRLLDSWRQFGQVQTVAIGPSNEVYDGHQRLSALLTVHGPSYQVDARRCSRELSDVERRALVVTLHAGAVGSWNWDNLANWDAGELQEWGFDSETLMTWQRDVGALDAFLESQQAETEIPEQQTEILPRQMLRILVSVPLDEAADVRQAINAISAPGLEVLYGAN